MFDDARSKRVVVVAHCLLNQNAISDGTADLPARFGEVIDRIMAKDVGIIQLPCPELACLGLNRGDDGGAGRELLAENSRIRTLMERPRPRELLREKARELADALEDYRKHGFAVLGLVGVDRSPSCGVGTTSAGGREIPGRGVFIEILAEEMERRGLDLRMIGTKTSRREESAARIEAWLGGL